MHYECVTDIKNVMDYMAGADIVAFDFETAPLEAFREESRAALDAHKADIVGVSLSREPKSAIYIPLRHRIGKNIERAEEVWLWLAEHFFLNRNILKIAHNLAFEAMFLYARGIVIQPPCCDTIAAAQLTLKSDGVYRNLSDSGLKKLAFDLLGEKLPTFENVTNGLYFDELDPQDAETIRYACADSDFALRLYGKFNAWFDRYLPKYRRLVEHVEAPASVFAGIMKYNGLLVDVALMEEKRHDATSRIDQLRQEITEPTDGVNVGANATTSAFRKYLYEDLGLPVVKVTAKNQAAMDDETMILLSEWCEKNKPDLVPLFKKVQEYRHLGKLLSTYIDGYQGYISPLTGRIHPNLYPLGTATGRFAARAPNMQNCFDDQTEILTFRGFVPFSELKNDDHVAQWLDGKIDFTFPQEIIAYDYSGEMVQLRNIHIDLCMTPDHRCLLQNRKNGEFFVKSAREYSEDAKQLHAGQYAFGNVSLSPAEITLLAAIQADGSYHDGGIVFTFSKARKYRRLINALHEMHIPYSDNVKKGGQVQIRIYKGPFTEWIMRILGEQKMWNGSVMQYSRDTVKNLLTEIMHWDGCFTRNNHYSSSVKQNADWMQILYALTGNRVNLRKYHNGNPNSAINYQLDVTRRNYSMTTNVSKKSVSYSGKVYCVRVPSGFIVVRRNGRICITGNCPRASSDALGIRNLFIAPEGKVLLSLDFSQIELRVGAFYCRDAKMLETYRKGGDIHAQTTSVIFHIPFEQAVDKHVENYKERRTIAKNCNFGTFFGLYPRGLQRTLHFKAGLKTSLPECEKIIANLKSGYPGLTRWQEITKKRAALRRYTETWFGRRRFLPDIVSRDWSKKSFAERCALNTPIQGTAAEILKLALGRLQTELKDRPWLRPLLQIHDELLFEIPEARLEEAVIVIKRCMEAQPFPEFDIPIIAEASAGRRFGEMAELEV